MESRMHITNVSNINFDKMEVIDNSKVKEYVHDTYNDIFLFEDIRSGIKRKDTLINVSLYDDLIIWGDEKFKILRMISK